MDHQGLARLQRAVLEDVGVDGEDGLGERGGLDQAELARDGQGVAGVAAGELGIAAAAQEGADLVARLPAAGGLDHLAGNLQAEGGRRARRRRVEAQALDDVRAVDARRRRP